MPSLMQSSRHSFLFYSTYVLVEVVTGLLAAPGLLSGFYVHELWRNHNNTGVHITIQLTL
jgi:hypothetical protein